MSKLKAYYFSHDSNASNDERILELEAKYDYAAYAWYFKILEKMRESSSFTLPVDETMLKKILGINSPQDIRFSDFMNDSFVCGLFEICDEDDTRFFSHSFRQRMLKANIKHTNLAESGKKGATAKWERYKASKATEKKQENNAISQERQTHV